MCKGVMFHVLCFVVSCFMFPIIYLWLIFDFSFFVTPFFARLLLIAVLCLSVMRVLHGETAQTPALPQATAQEPPPLVKRSSLGDWPAAATAGH